MNPRSPPNVVPTASLVQMTPGMSLRAFATQGGHGLPPAYPYQQQQQQQQQAFHYHQAVSAPTACQSGGGGGVPATLTHLPSPSAASPSFPYPPRMSPHHQMGIRAGHPPPLQHPMYQQYHQAVPSQPSPPCSPPGPAMDPTSPKMGHATYDPAKYPGQPLGYGAPAHGGAYPNRHVSC